MAFLSASLVCFRCYFCFLLIYKQKWIVYLWPQHIFIAAICIAVFSAEFDAIFLWCDLISPLLCSTTSVSNLDIYNVTCVFTIAVNKSDCFTYKLMVFLFLSTATNEISVTTAKTGLISYFFVFYRNAVSMLF